MIRGKITPILFSLLIISTTASTVQAINLNNAKISISKNLSYLSKNGDVHYWGVIIGLFEYKNGAQLPSSAVNKMFNAMLSSKNWNKDNLRFITNEKATKEGIRSAIKWLASVSDENDFVFFYYNGHCSQFPDDNGDEKDGKDEALIPYEYNSSKENPIIRDDELGQWLDEIKAKGLCLAFDTCHSGGLVEEKNHLSTDYIRVKDISNGFINDIKGDNRVIIVSSGEKFLTYIDRAFDGLLTNGLGNAFKGLADFNRDKICTAEEAFTLTEIFHIAAYSGLIASSIAMGFINPVLALCIPAAVLIVELVTYLSYHSFAFSFAIMYDNYDGELPIIEL